MNGSYKARIRFREIPRLATGFLSERCHIGGTGHESIKQDDSFRRAYQQGTRQYDSPVGKIDAVFAMPSNPKTDVPVILAPGWTEGKEALKACASGVYEAGRPVIVFDHPRIGGTDIRQSLYSRTERRKAAVIEEIIHQENLNQVDLIAHSEGAINASIAALNNPARIRSLLLVTPAGLIGEDTIKDLTKRAIAEHAGTPKRARDIFSPKNIKTTVYGTRHVLQNPPRALLEIDDIAHSRLEDVLRKAHEQETNIIIMHGVDDKLFPMDRMQQIVKSAQNPDGFVRGFVSVQGGHNEILHDPRYIRAAETLLPT